ncbi:Protein CBG20115 [Caenorhabditis briggsae]|uniref:Protein CBG20115 n=1 Tax=Caenorhabditis briggsae TaxID=6238 RepID=A8XX45_CAEBR|nr:Protein CBG20115 [Caenorhabditis briggsae]CAP37214.2 Protein CBG20115 [Caenorhabditis briggsae]
MSSLRQSSTATSPTSPVTRNVYSRGSVDVESGEISQPNSHKRPYTPGASPREILFAQSVRQLPSPSQTSPHGSRFMDGYRRRMRQASLNLPSETQQLDEDLGFPPVCSPPPEVFCGSISGNQMRNRSNSEAHPSMRMKSTHSLGNGGLLVFFPTSPSSSSNNSGPLSHRRESHTDETAEDAIVWSTNNDKVMRHWKRTNRYVEMASVGGGCSGKSLKRPPDTSGSSSSSSGNNSAANLYSPRQRPLFVDTQMTNHLQQQDSAMKRRSPVSQVVDFVRGRNRTYSLQLSSSPMCSPQSVGARASASCDGPPQPLLPSPGGRRQTLSGRVHRASFTGGTLKSFDSGLDLSSPTINHTALLIKE